MIFLLTEQVMNGTVTMSVHTTLIDAPNWEGAVDKLRSLPNWNKITDISAQSDGIVYWVGNTRGHLCKKPAEVI